jgi:hypothetical protein
MDETCVEQKRDGGEFLVVLSQWFIQPVIYTYCTYIVTISSMFQAESYFTYDALTCIILVTYSI